MEDKKKDISYQQIFEQTVMKKAGQGPAGDNTKSSHGWMGMMGIIGWSVTIPLLLGLGLGIYIDRIYPSRFSFALMLMFGGLLLGCITAVHWARWVLHKRDE